MKKMKKERFSSSDKARNKRERSVAPYVTASEWAMLRRIAHNGTDVDQAKQARHKLEVAIDHDIFLNGDDRQPLDADDIENIVKQAQDI